MYSWGIKSYSRDFHSKPVKIYKRNWGINIAFQGISKNINKKISRDFLLGYGIYSWGIKSFSRDFNLKSIKIHKKTWGIQIPFQPFQSL